MAFALEQNHRRELVTIEARPVDVVADDARPLDTTSPSRAGLTQGAVAQRMGTTKSAISRLECSGKHTPSIGTLQRYAEAVGCEHKIELAPKTG